MQYALAVIFVGLTAALALQAWLLLHVRDQQARVLSRITGLTAPRVRPSAPKLERRELPLGMFGQPAPRLELSMLDGGRVPLDALRSLGKPVMLFFAEPRCGPCYELLPDIGGWMRVYGDRLTMALVSAGAPAQNHAMTAEYGINAVLLQKDLEAVEAFQLLQAPSAVLILPDGTIGSRPAYGVRMVRELVADTLGLELPAIPPRAIQSVAMGEMAPAIRRPDLDGNVVDLVARDGSTLLLFWSPGCEHCRELQPEIQTWTKRADGPRVLVVSRGPIALNQEANLGAPVVLDDDHAIMDMFGVVATPSAVLIDSAGFVATKVARGGANVRALAARRWLPADLAAD
jgi:thiol-disulfide isomerase/thioredoxin